MIYYYIPDVTFRSGGVDLLHKHVALGAELGLPIKRVEANATIQASDTLILPEGAHDLVRALKDHTNVVSMVLNPFYVFYAPPALAHTCVTNNQYTADMLTRLGHDAHLFKTAVRSEYYPEPKLKRICYLTRKSGHQIEHLRNVLRCIDSRFIDEFEWIGMFDLSDEAFAHTIQTSCALVSLSTAEGWSGMMVEAMRCRTRVFGYKNGQPDLRGLASAYGADFVELAFGMAPYLSALLEGSVSAYEPILDEAYAASLEFTPGTERASLIELWKTLDPTICSCDQNGS